MSWAHWRTSLKAPIPSDYSVQNQLLVLKPSPTAGRTNAAGCLPAEDSWVQYKAITKPITLRLQRRCCCAELWRLHQHTTSLIPYLTLWK
jgi:hypothetical protein